MGNKKIIRSLEKIITKLKGAETPPEADLKRRQKIQSILYESLCNAVQLGSETALVGIQINTPFYFPDGDPYMIYLKELPDGDLRLTDGGHTFMHMSYESTWHPKRLTKILVNTCICEKDGELFVEFPAQILGSYLLRFGQAIAMVCALSENGAD